MNGNNTVVFSDFFQTVANFYGAGIPLGIGDTTVAVNYNGDPCDVYGNILLEPHFEDPFDMDFSLLEISPCIDAGDPVLPLDPDNSIADIGAIPFDNVPSPMISFSSDLISYSITGIGQTSAMPLTVYNLGQADLILDSILVELFPSAFTTTWNQPGEIITPGDSVEMEIIFTPQEQNFYIDNLFFYSNDDPESIMLMGQGIVLAVDDPATIPQKFVLHPASPNPFNPATQLHFSLDKPGFTELSVYDTQGRLVENMVSNHFAAGNYKVNFNAENLPSGVYFARLSSNEQAQMQKLVFLK